MTQFVDRLPILTRHRHCVCNDFSDLPLLSVSNYYGSMVQLKLPVRGHGPPYTYLRFAFGRGVRK